MLRLLARLPLALAIALAWATPVTSETIIIKGEEVEPTERQCLAALESGNLIPFTASERRWRAETYAMHRGRVFLIAMEGGTLSCRAWEW